MQARPQACPNCGLTTRVPVKLDGRPEPVDCRDCGQLLWPGDWLWRLSRGVYVAGLPPWVARLVNAEMLLRGHRDLPSARRAVAPLLRDLG